MQLQQRSRRRSCRLTSLRLRLLIKPGIHTNGDAEKARTEKARTENAAPSGRGGNGENGKVGK